MSAASSSSPSSLILRCVEPNTRPMQATLNLQPGTRIRLYLLSDQPEGFRGLRRTVLRPAEEHPPLNAQLLLGIEVSASGMVLQEVSRSIPIEIIRGEIRSRVSTGLFLKSAGRFEVVVTPTSRFEFGMSLTARSSGDMKMLAGGSGARVSQALAAARGAMWLVPTAWTLLTDADDVVIDNLKAIAKRLGLSQGAIRYLLTIGFYFASMAALWYWQETQKADLEVRTGDAEAALARSEASRAASLESEGSCLRDRQDLVNALNEKRKLLGLQAETALAFSAAQATALDLAGERLGGNDLQKRDVSARPALIDLVAFDIEDTPKINVPEECLKYQSLLGDDLPRYLLLWHPVNDIACPIQYTDVVDGIPLAGRWGVSERISREFGTPDAAMDATGIADLRLDDRWLAQTLSTAARVMLTILLDYDGDGRPVLMPSQSQLWTVAILGAYNRMPASPDGVLDQGAPICINDVLEQIAKTSTSASPGEPILPDIQKVATGDIELLLERTPGCPWPADGLKEGALDAIRAATRLASVPPEEAE